jgi:hypothetical protein
MFWECSECGGVTEQPKPPDRCAECGTAGVVLVPGGAYDGDVDSEEMRASCVVSDGDSPAWARACRLRCA